VVKALTPGFFAREDTRTPLYIAIVAIATNIVLNVVFLYGTTLAQVGIALASSISGWLNAALLAGVLLRRGQWAPDSRLRSRTPRVALATLGMGAVLWGTFVLLAPALTHGNLVGIAALLGLCALGCVWLLDGELLQRLEVLGLPLEVAERIDQPAQARDLFHIALGAFAIGPKVRRGHAFFQRGQLSLKLGDVKGTSGVRRRATSILQR
jgi:putative peptidoglycan lipid II flippase